MLSGESNSVRMIIDEALLNHVVILSLLNIFIRSFVASMFGRNSSIASCSSGRDNVERLILTWVPVSHHAII